VKPAFRHLHAAHCESGVTASLFANAGFSISEPMAFGIGSGLFFVHAPFVTVMGFPLTSYRTYPGTIFRKVCRRLGVSYRMKAYRSRGRAMAELDALLTGGTPVGLQANIHWLPYFPPEFRSQFNGHNLIATGVEDGAYDISDPVLETAVKCPADALARARFSKGPLAPRGVVYYPVSFPKEPDFSRAVRAGIRDTCRQNLHLPLPWTGVRGIRHLARKVRAYPEKIKDPRRARLTLAFVIRMQEEVGTGGAGFRFMYAAFLQEAGRMLSHDPLLRASEMMTSTGDLWREFGAAAARLIKERDDGRVTYNSLGDMLEGIAGREEQVLRFLLAAA
jgi:hypothetical protein